MKAVVVISFVAYQVHQSWERALDLQHLED